MKASDYVANWQNSWVIANWKMNPSTQLTVTALMTDLQQQLLQMHCKAVTWLLRRVLCIYRPRNKPFNMGH